MRLKILLFVLGMTAVGGFASAQTVDEIIEKHIAAVGGPDKIQAIQTLKLTGTVTRGAGFETRFTLYWKRPNLARSETEIRGETMIQAYDGKTAWGIVPFRGNAGPRELPQRLALALLQRADFTSPLVNHQEKGFSVALLGKEEFEGTEVYKLQLRREDAERTIYVYLDAEHYMELKRVVQGKTPEGNEFEFTTLFSDYKPVQGVMMAHVRETHGTGFGRRGRGGRTVLTIEKVEVNLELADALFKMPEKKP